MIEKEKILALRLFKCVKQVNREQFDSSASILHIFEQGLS